MNSLRPQGRPQRDDGDHRRLLRPVRRGPDGDLGRLQPRSALHRRAGRHRAAAGRRQRTHTRSESLVRDLLVARRALDRPHGLPPASRELRVRSRLAARVLAGRLRDALGAGSRADSYRFFTLEWAPDSRIALSLPSPPSVRILAADGGSSLDIAVPSPEYADGLTWSPTGSRLVVHGRRSTADDVGLYLVDPTGSPACWTPAPSRQTGCAGLVRRWHSRPVRRRGEAGRWDAGSLVGRARDHDSNAAHP